MSTARGLFLLLLVCALLIVPAGGLLAQDTPDDPEGDLSAEVVAEEAAEADEAEAAEVVAEEAVEETDSIPQGMSLLMFLLGLAAITVVGLAGARNTMTAKKTE